MKISVTKQLYHLLYATAVHRRTTVRSIVKDAVYNYINNVPSRPFEVSEAFLEKGDRVIAVKVEDDFKISDENEENFKEYLTCFCREELEKKNQIFLSYAKQAKIKNEFFGMCNFFEEI